MIPNLCYAEPCVMHSNDDGILMLSAKDGEFFLRSSLGCRSETFIFSIRTSFADDFSRD